MKLLLVIQDITNQGHSFHGWLYIATKLSTEKWLRKLLAQFQLLYHRDYFQKKH